MSTRYRLLPAFFLAGALSTWSFAFADTPHDGKYYLDNLKDSIIEVLEEHQPLINRNPDGSLKSEDLLPQAIYERSYATFKKVIGADFSQRSVEGEKSPDKIGHILACFLQAARENIAELQPLINKEPDGSAKLKKFVPAVFGRLAAERFKQKTGISIKQTTLGKGEFKARNPLNLPDEWEASVLVKFDDPGWELNKGFGELAGTTYRYAKPLYIKKGCMACHGEPAGESDAYGHPKEQYDIGATRGAISVTIPVN